MSDSEATLTLVLKARNLANREVDRLHRGLGRLHGSVSRLGGALVTLGKVGILAVITGIVAAVGFLGMATKAAAEEQKGIVKLDAALKSNVRGWKGNTDAIEKVIRKREDLAFSDDALRASLATLVTKYKNVGQAMKIQAVAMDVARLKGISLEAATSLVSKGMDGSVKVLKQLGIVLPKTATEQERLTAIQKRAAGQAEAYGKTAAGAQEAFQIAIGDVVEDIGSGLIPIMTQAFTWLRTTGIPAVRGIIGSIQGWLSANRPLIDQIRNVLVKVIGFVIDKVHGVVTWIGNLVGAISRNRDAMNVLRTIAAGIAEAASLAWKAISMIVTWIGNVVGTITGNKAVIAGFGTAFDIVATAIRTVVNAIRDVIKFGQDAIGVLASILGGGPKVKGFSQPGRSGKGYATGGWAGLHGPERAWLGEKGPEYVVPNHQLGAAPRGPSRGVVLEGVSEDDLADIIDRKLYVRIRRAVPTVART